MGCCPEWRGRAGYFQDKEDRLLPFTLPGIGKPVLSKYRTRRMCNPGTWAEIKIPAKIVGRDVGVKADKDAIVPPRK
jgi:hypothetical protein